jgi:hypothetical protein
LQVPEAKSSWRKSLRPRAVSAAALLCLALLTFLVLVQVVHLHPLDSKFDSRADQCLLCAVLHSASPAAVAAAVILVASFAAPAPFAESRTPVRLRYSRLFIRPPPSCC